MLLLCLTRTTTLQGLAIIMFLLAMAANILYGGGILLRCPDLATLWSSLPWLLGSLGTVGLDLTIYGQYHYYRRHLHLDKQRGSDELLLGAEDGL